MVQCLKYSLLPVLILALFLPFRQVLANTDSASQGAGPVSDVRILIDVSGSMKKNDPHNLRAPALRMLIGLMPKGAVSGVWTFAKYVNMLVPLHQVDANWRKLAEKQSHRIHSYGLYTNIEQVLAKATVNIHAADPHYRRSIILLSDGLVDLPAGKKASQRSRQRILDRIVPRLKKAKVAVHTIALSSHADHKLLKAISMDTGGWYEQVDTAEQLQRVFLHLFEKSAMRDTVPLTDNNFKIDKSVKEMTILVFRTKHSAPTKLVLPNKSILSAKDQSDDVHWHSEDDYDLITIEKPMAGKWHINAKLDPDNRVMVVTDLQLKTTNLPNNILTGESFDLKASLTNKGKVIKREKFLKLVNASLTQNNQHMKPFSSTIGQSQQKGVFVTHIGDKFQPGPNDIVVTMKSPTFERQRRQTINVIAMPFDIKNKQVMNASSRTHKITVTSNTDLINPGSVKITALLTGQDGSEWSYDMVKKSDNEWQLTLADLDPKVDYKLALQIRGQTQNGRTLFLQPSPLILQDVTPPPAAKPAVPAAPAKTEKSQQKSTATQAVSQAKTTVKSAKKAAKIKAPVIEPKTKKSTLSPKVIFAIGNIIILMLLAAGFYFWRRQNPVIANPGEMI